MFGERVLRSPLIVMSLPLTETILNLSACSKSKSVEAMTMSSPTFQLLASSSTVIVLVLWSAGREEMCT